MSQLQNAVARLSGLLTPPVGSTNQKKIFLPQSDDPNSDFKQRLINRGNTALDSGQAALAGQSVPALPEFGESDFQDIAMLLDNDPQQRDFLEFASAIQAVAAAVNQAAI